jgi:hypothetical protein
VQRQSWLADADVESLAHKATCEHCAAEVVVRMSRTRVERRPWRMVWWCSVCGRQSRVLVPDELVGLMVSWDRAGGTSLSMREVADMVGVSLDEFERAVDEELR